MKKIILVAAFLSIGFIQTSCNKDDDKYELPAATLLGKWNYAKEGQMVGDSEVLVDYSDNEVGCSRDYIIFNANNTLIDVDYDSTDSPCEEFTGGGTYAVTGNIIVVNFGDGPESVEIMNLSATELKVKDAEGYIQVFQR